ncbi:MAG: type IV pilus biogenesis/stability protein PilW [Polyangiales bacterium]
MALSALGGRARADEDSDKAAAEALFDEGRKLMGEGKFDEACPKLEASQRLDPGVGTLLNLADCLEKRGKTASAWAQFREASSAAHKTGSLEREEIARTRANELEAKLAYLTIETWKGQRVQVTRDGSAVDEAVLGSAIPVDPGEHVISASATGKRSWSTTVTVGEASRVSVAVPILPDEAQAPGAAPGAAAGATAPTASDSGSGASNSSLRIAAVAVGAVGVIGIGLGIGFGADAMSKWSDAKAHCNPYPYCGAEGQRLGDRAKTSATISTIAFAIGAAGIAGGIVLWVNAPSKHSESQASVAFGPGSVALRGSY